MNRMPPEYTFFILMTAGVLYAAAAGTSFTGYLALSFLVLEGIALYATRMWPDRGFYLLLCGQLLVVACGSVTIWAGLFTALMLAGVVQGSWGEPEGPAELRSFAIFCCASFGIALLLDFSNHVLLPLLVLAAVAGLVVLVQMVRRYRFRKQYAGVVA